MPMGRAYLRLSLHGNDRLVGSLPVEFVAEPMITMIQPTNVLLSSGNRPVVTVYGNYFIDTEMMLCRFGQRQTVRGQVTQGSKILCVVPDTLQTGNVTIELLSDASMMISRPHTIHVQGSIVVYESFPKQIRFQQQLITLTGSNFIGLDVARCVFENAAKKTAIILSSTLLLCATPEKSSGSKFFLEINGQTLKSFQGEWSRQSSEITYIFPSVCTTSRESIVTVYGKSFDLNDNFQCTFGEFVHSAILLSSSTLSCTCPGEIQWDSDSTSLKIWRLEDPRNMISLAIDLIPLPTVESKLIDVMIPNQQQIFVQGKQFLKSPSLSCRYNKKQVVKALRLSSSLLTCSIPSTIISIGFLDISNDGIHYSKDVVSITTYSIDSKQIFSLIPSAGFVGGGTRVYLQSSAIITSVTITHCVFGDAGIVQVQMNAHNQYFCVAPAHQQGRTEVRLMLKDTALYDDRQSSHSHWFLYVDEPEVMGVYPSLARSGREAIITITGRNLFMPDAFCSFGNASITHGRAVTSTLLVCIAPPMPMGR
eukprot:765825-Hanusia_phi.AAC.1